MMISTWRHACPGWARCPLLSTGGSKTSVPPWPSSARLKLAAAYWPSIASLAVCVPSVTVSVPLKVLPV